MALQLEVTEPSPPLCNPQDRSESGHSRAVRGSLEHPLKHGLG